MKKNLPIILIITVLAIIVIIAVSIVINNFNANKHINPDTNLTNLSENDLKKVKEDYEKEGKKEEFLGVCSEVELAVVNRILDGSVTNDDELAFAISKINSTLSSKDWSNLELSYPSYWMGTWRLNEKARLYFKFMYDEIKPSWANDTDVLKYVE